MKLISILLFLLILFGCKSTKNEPLAPVNIDYNQKFEELLGQFKADGNSVSYEEMWHVYLKSDQIQNSAVKQDDYLDILNQLESGQKNCDEIDWLFITSQNFWSIKPHISAATCYQMIGDGEKSKYHNSAVEFLLTGILSSGDGSNYYSAYEVATWGDASDFIALTDYEVVDTYLSLLHHGQALYFIYLVNDPETGLQQEIFFENSKFLHAILEIQYPFVGISDYLEKHIIDQYAETQTYANIAKASLLTAKGEIDEGINTLLTSSNDESAVASYRLGMLCFNEIQTVLPRTDCLSFLFRSAELGYYQAVITLAFIYKEGITVEQDTTLFEELMSSAQQYYRPGEAWFKFASLYNTEFGGKRRELAIKYTFNSAEQGFLRGKLTLLKIRASETDVDDLDEAKDIENEVKKLAEKGLTEAQVIYSQLLFSRYSQGSEQWERAQHWIELASEKGHPVANFLRGVAFEYGYFGTKDFFEAYRYYNDAALNYHADSQLKIGYFNGIGRVVEKNKALAILWYSLCAKSDNLDCIRNLAINHLEGTIDEPNYELARFLFKYAAEKGHIRSKTSLGTMYVYGKGVEADYPLANKLFEQACDGKDGEACQYLATSYQKGKGVEIDLTIANQLYTKSCNLNNYGGCLGLAIMYEVGEGVEINTSKAKSYFKRACQLGSNISCHKANGLLN